MFYQFVEILHELGEVKYENIEFVYGSGKRKSNVEKFLEALSEYQNRQIKYDESKKIFNGGNSYSKTDNDTTFMRMKDDHMRNSQLKAGYNIQLGVESEYVVGVGVFSDRNDTTTLKPFLENTYDFLTVRFQNVIADSGYESEENYVYLEEKRQNYYIKPQTYEKWKKRRLKNDISKRENMFYNPDTDEYIGHNAKQLKLIYQMKKKSVTG